MIPMVNLRGAPELAEESAVGFERIIERVRSRGGRGFRARVCDIQCAAQLCRPATGTDAVELRVGRRRRPRRRGCRAAARWSRGQWHHSRHHRARQRGTGQPRYDSTPWSSTAVVAGAPLRTARAGRAPRADLASTDLAIVEGRGPLPGHETRQPHSAATSSRARRPPARAATPARVVRQRRELAHQVQLLGNRGAVIRRDLSSVSIVAWTRFRHGAPRQSSKQLATGDVARLQALQHSSGPTRPDSPGNIDHWCASSRSRVMAPPAGGTQCLKALVHAGIGAAIRTRHGSISPLAVTRVGRIPPRERIANLAPRPPPAVTAEQAGRRSSRSSRALRAWPDSPPAANRRAPPRPPGVWVLGPVARFLHPPVPASILQCIHGRAHCGCSTPGPPTTRDSPGFNGTCCGAWPGRRPRWHDMWWPWARAECDTRRLGRGRRGKRRCQAQQCGSWHPNTDSNSHPEAFGTDPVTDQSPTRKTGQRRPTVGKQLADTLGPRAHFSVWRKNRHQLDRLRSSYLDLVPHSRHTAPKRSPSPTPTPGHYDTSTSGRVASPSMTVRTPIVDAQPDQELGCRRFLTQLTRSDNVSY